MNLHLAVRDAAGSHQHTPDQLPLAIGHAEDAAIRLPGGGPEAPVAFLGYSAGRFFLQPGSGGRRVSVQGAPLRESRWVEGGEVLLTTGCTVRFTLGSAGLAVSVDTDATENITIPPVVEETPVPDVGTDIPTEEEITPLKYERSGAVAGLRRRRRFPVTGTVVTTAILVLAVAAWFMRTASWMTA